MNHAKTEQQTSNQSLPLLSRGHQSRSHSSLSTSQDVLNVIQPQPHLFAKQFTQNPRGTRGDSRLWSSLHSVRFSTGGKWVVSIESWFRGQLPCCWFVLFFFVFYLRKRDFKVHLIDWEKKIFCNTQFSSVISIMRQMIEMLLLLPCCCRPALKTHCVICVCRTPI